MSIKVKKYTETHREEWEEMVRRAPAGTLYHRRDFLDYHPSDRFEEHSLLFYYKGENLLGVLPLAYDRSDGVLARSPFGGSYGGLVLSEGCPFRYVNRIVESAMEYLRSNGVDRVRIRPTPREQCHTPSAYQEFSYRYHGFEIADQEVTSVIDLSRFDDDPFDIYESRCRRAVRKAKKEGLTVKADTDDWGMFHGILTDTLDRHGKKPTHSLRDLRSLYDLVPNRIRLSLAYLDDTPVAGIMVFLLNETTACIYYNCHKTDYREYNPVNLLIDNEIRWANKNGYRYVDQGTSIENDYWNDGLVKFKESFGASGHFRTVYKNHL